MGMKKLRKVRMTVKYDFDWLGKSIGMENEEKLQDPDEEILEISGSEMHSNMGIDDDASDNMFGHVIKKYPIDKWIKQIPVHVEELNKEN
jgi:hypothetical protein